MHTVSSRPVQTQHVFLNQRTYSEVRAIPLSLASFVADLYGYAICESWLSERYFAEETGIKIQHVDTMLIIRAIAGNTLSGAWKNEAVTKAGY